MRHIKTKRNSKEKNQRYHAKVRMLQHYGVQLTNLDLEKMAEIYRHHPDTRILIRQSNRITKAVIPYNGQCYPIVYDHKRHQLVTVLNVDYLSERQRRIYDQCCYRLEQKKLSHDTTSGQTVLDDNLIPDVETEQITEEYEEEQTHVDNSYVFISSDEEAKQLMQDAFNRLPK